MSPFIIGFLLLVAAGGGFAFGHMAGREQVASQGELGELKDQVLVLEEAKTTSDTKAAIEQAKLKKQVLELGRQLTEESDNRRKAVALSNEMASDVLAVHRIIAKTDNLPDLKEKILDVITKREYER